MVALGVVVVLAGLAVLLVEAHASTAGILGLAGVLAAAAGIGLMMAGVGAPLLVAVPIAAALALAGVVAAMRMARHVWVAHRRAVRTGPGALIGATATVRTWDGDEGQVAAAGTLWRARMTYGWEDAPPAPGQTVIVDELDGLTVSVHQPDEREVMPVWKPSSLSS